MKYMGSKRRIAPDISGIINDIAAIEGITEYYEPFMGGCSVGELVNIKNRHMSDINENIVELFKKLQTGMFEYKFITEEEWYKIKEDKDKAEKYPRWLIGWCAIMCSWRGRPFEGYAGEYLDKTYNRMVNTQLQGYNSTLKEVDLIKNMEFKTQNYWEIGHPHGAVIYLDPPYRGTKSYTMVEQFDFDKFDEWVIDLAKDNLVLISEYRMNGNYANNFKVLRNWNLGTGIGAGRQTDDSFLEYIESLFYVDGGYLTDKYFNDDEELDF